MTQADTAAEYAIEVPGRGYMGYAVSHVSANPGSCMPTIQDAEECLRQARNRFIAMGCEDIAQTLRIARREITVTVGDWKPV